MTDDTWLRPISSGHAARERWLRNRADLCSFRAWVGFEASDPGKAFAQVAERLFAGHLAILSEPWVQSQCNRYVGQQCPFCPCWGDERDHEASCPWIISARACGIAN